MELLLEGIVVIVGNCGSGKTEVSVNLALDQSSKGKQVKIADLDLINPYFRVREVRNMLAEYDIQVALPPDEYLHADLPILSPVVSGMIRTPPELLILDVGGAGIGATVLAALNYDFIGKKNQMFYVINPNRPFTHTVDDCLKMRYEIEVASKIKISGIIGNANIMTQTTIEDIYKGYYFVEEVSKNAKLPISFVVVPSKIIPELDFDKIKCPILPLYRQLVPPWMNSESVGR